MVPGIPTQLAAWVGIVLAWIDPTGALSHGLTQGVVISGLGLVIAVMHAVQAYHRRTVSTAAPSTSTPPPPAARVG